MCHWIKIPNISYDVRTQTSAKWATAEKRRDDNDDKIHQTCFFFSHLLLFPTCFFYFSSLRISPCRLSFAIPINQPKLPRPMWSDSLPLFASCLSSRSPRPFGLRPWSCGIVVLPPFGTAPAWSVFSAPPAPPPRPSSLASVTSTAPSQSATTSASTWRRTKSAAPIWSCTPRSATSGRRPATSKWRSSSGPNNYAKVCWKLRPQPCPSITKLFGQQHYFSVPIKCS